MVAEVVHTCTYDHLFHTAKTGICIAQTTAEICENNSKCWIEEPLQQQASIQVLNSNVIYVYTTYIFILYNIYTTYLHIYEQLYTYYITMFTYSINGLTIKESSQSLEFPILQIRCGAPNGLTRWHWKGKKSPTVPHPEMVCWGSSKKKTVEFLKGFKSQKKPTRNFEVRDIETSHSLFLCNHETNLGSILQPWSQKLKNSYPMTGIHETDWHMKTYIFSLIFMVFM